MRLLLLVLIGVGLVSSGAHAGTLGLGTDSAVSGTNHLLHLDPQDKAQVMDRMPFEDSPTPKRSPRYLLVLRYQSSVPTNGNSDLLIHPYTMLYGRGWQYLYETYDDMDGVLTRLNAPGNEWTDDMVVGLWELTARNRVRLNSSVIQHVEPQHVEERKWHERVWQDENPGEQK